jgi:hypothetical protein
MEGDGEVWTEGDGEVKVKWRERREGDGKVWTEGDACRIPAHHVPTKPPVTLLSTSNSRDCLPASHVTVYQQFT